MLTRRWSRVTLLGVAAALSACTTTTAWQAPSASFQLAAIADRSASPNPVGLQGGDPTPPHAQDDNTRRPDGSGPATSPSPPPKSGGGGSSGGGASAPAVPTVLESVVDRQGTPIAGATVLFADGTQFVTGGDGRFPADAKAPLNVACTVFAPGHVSSTIAGGTLPPVLHLERLTTADPGFEGDEFYLRGTVAWLEAPPLGGTVQYQDDLGSLSYPAVVDHEGYFTLRVVTRRAGRPTGRLMALAAGADNVPMMGLSAAFSLLDQGAELINVTVVKASRTVNFTVGAAPAGLTEVTNQLEFAAGTAAPFVMQGPGTTSGTYKLPQPGAMGVTTRLIATAREDDGGRLSQIALDPYALPATPTAFLAPPTLSVDASARQLSWAAPAGTDGVRLAIAQAPTLTEAYWEGWFEGATRHTFDVADWPTGASATARLTAYDGAFASARHVASARHLRLLPTGDWTGGFRWAETTTTITP